MNAWLRRIGLLAVVVLTGCAMPLPSTQTKSVSVTEPVVTTVPISTVNEAIGTAAAPTDTPTYESPVAKATLPTYQGEPYQSVSLDDFPTVKQFIEEIHLLETTVGEESYSELDSLGRCGYCYAVITPDMMPTEERGEIGNVRPSGWDYEGHSNNKKYPDQIQDTPAYLYNRCHLIGYQLTGENDNERNLITGTRYLNISGMLELENTVAEYVRKTQNPVAYFVQPMFVDDERVCRGVLMIAYSVLDHGESLSECIYAFNVQPEITINYQTGENHITGEE